MFKLLLNKSASTVFGILDFLNPNLGILTGAICGFLYNPLRIYQLLCGEPYTPAIPLQNSVAQLRSVTINGAYHSLLIRGNNYKAPVILVLHGGPGATDIPFNSSYGKILEDKFVVVHYDQRGACKSGNVNFKLNNNDFDGTLTIDQHVDDAVAISEWLMANPALPGAREGLYLIGGSWGSMLALLTLQKRPELFKRAILRGTCVGVSMYVQKHKRVCVCVNRSSD